MAFGWKETREREREEGEREREREREKEREKERERKRVCSSWSHFPAWAADAAVRSSPPPSSSVMDPMLAAAGMIGWMDGWKDG
jgi:hypothetical protein